MDYKEKYEMALEGIQEILDSGEDSIKMSRLQLRLQGIFPELAEFEDDKVRKELIKHLKELSDWKEDEVIPVKNPSYYRQWASWLENIPVIIDHEKRERFHLGYREALDYAGGFCVLKKNEQRMVSAEESLGIDSDTYNKIVDECIFGEQKPEENKGNIGVISSNSALSEENEPQKKLVESYLAKFDKKFPILPTLKGKQLADYKNFLNKCQQIFGLKYWGIHPTQAKLFEKLSLLWAAWGAEHLQGLGQTDGDMDNEISMWSEEDEEHIDSLLKRLDALCRNKFERTRFAISEDEDWLKSLRPQSRWKPTDEQMGCLSDAIEHYNSLGYPASKLKELLDDLKKLKEGKV